MKNCDLVSLHHKQWHQDDIRQLNHLNEIHVPAKLSICYTLQFVHVNYLRPTTFTILVCATQISKYQSSLDIVFISVNRNPSRQNWSG